MPGLRDIFKGEDARRAAQDARRRAEAEEQAALDEQRRQVEAEKHRVAEAERARIKALEEQSETQLYRSGLDKVAKEIADRKDGSVEDVSLSNSRFSDEPDPDFPAGSASRRVRWDKKRVGSRKLESEGPLSVGEAPTGSATFLQNEDANEIEIVSDPQGNITVNGERVPQGDTEALDKALGHAYSRPRKVRRRIRDYESYQY